MHILYDGRIYLTQPAGGVNRYFSNVIDRLPATDRITMTLPRAPQVNFPQHPNLHAVVAREGVLAGATRPVELRRAVRGLDADLLHPTYYRLLDHRSMRRSDVPVVLTVYDMVHEHFRDRLDRWGIRAEIKRRALRAASAVMCISESTRSELLRFHPWLDADRLHVVHLASELQADTPRDDSLVPEHPFLLHVGSRFWYKDFDLLLQALRAIAPSAPDLQLVVVGPPISDEEASRIAGLGLTGRVHAVGVVDDTKLAALYRASRALVYPSRYEGFGIPPLEAMACGTLVVAADSTSIPEVVDDAALLFEPGSLDGLVTAIEATLHDTTERTTLLERGRARAATFSWERAASETRAVYESVL